MDAFAALDFAGSRAETWLASDGTTVQDTLSYQYDSDGNVTVAGDNAGTYTMSYDLDDRMTFEKEPFGATVSYSYDGMGDITLQQDNFGGVMTSIYDPDQELNNVKFSQGGSAPSQMGIQIDYQEDGQANQIRYYATAAETTILETTRHDYNSADRLAVIEHDHGGGNYLYTYTSDTGADDGGDQLQSANVHGVNTSFSYDATGQLSLSQSSAYGTHTYSYDAEGNSAAAGTTIGTDNRLTTDGTFSYSYDADGNRTTKISIAGGDAWTYAYDDGNRLITVKHYSSSSGGVPTGTVLLEEDFTFDVFGNRLSDTLQSGSTTVTRFAYDQNGNAWADLNSSNVLVTRHLFLNGVDELFARIDAATGHGYFYYTDAQNTVTDIMDESSGNVLDQINYDAYGNILHETAASYSDRYKYTGREWDAAIGLQYNRGDNYDPLTRTWISPDALQSDPLKNFYRYVGNDPMDGTDPRGEQDKPNNGAAKSVLDRAQEEEWNRINRRLLSSQHDPVKDSQLAAARAVAILLSQNAQPPTKYTGASIRAVTPQDEAAWARNRRQQQELEARERSAASFQTKLSAMNPIFKPDGDLLERVRQKRVISDAEDWAKLSPVQQVFYSLLEQAIWGLALAGVGEFAALPKVGQVASKAEMLEFIKSNPRAVENGLANAFETTTGKFLSFSERSQLNTALRESLPKVEADLAAQKTVNPGKLSFDPATKSWTSNGGLVYEQGSVQGNRVLHVLDHLSPNPLKSLHTLFNVDRTQLVGLLDEAWAARHGAGVLQSNGNRVFDVAMGRVIGTRGETTIHLVVRDGTTKVITAFPVP